jgi:hypothetical protein
MPDTNMPELDETVWMSDQNEEMSQIEVPQDATVIQITRNQAIAYVATIFLIGAILGQTVGGWWLWPVVWTDATFNELSTIDKANAVLMASRLYSFDLNSYYPARMFDTWPEEERHLFICTMWVMSPTIEEQSRLEYLARSLSSTGEGCDG